MTSQWSSPIGKLKKVERQGVWTRQTPTLGQFEEHEPLSLGLSLIGDAFRLLEWFCKTHRELKNSLGRPGKCVALHGHQQHSLDELVWYTFWR